MKFGLSEGMMLAAGGEGDVHLLIPGRGGEAGAKGALRSCASRGELEVFSLWSRRTILIRGDSRQGEFSYGNG